MLSLPYKSIILKEPHYGTTPVSDRSKPSAAPYHSLSLLQQGNLSEGTRFKCIRRAGQAQVPDSRG